MPDGRLVRLAEPGARVRDVRAHQLPLVVDADIVTVLAGLNDIARAGFDAQTLRADLMAIVDELTAAGAHVVLGRLHDPTRMLPVPKTLADVVRRRVREVNTAVDTAAAAHGGHVLDLADVPALKTAGGWSADRIHPSRAGHQGMAAAAAEALAPWYDQLPAAVPPPRSAPRGPSRTARAWWAMRHGLPYLAGHLDDFGPPLLSALAHRV
jgi:lysophospholipase L1-like esterase